MSYLANHHMITDPLLPAAIRIFFLLLELIMMLIVIGVSSDNPVFACHITECTYAKLPTPEYLDQVSSTWNPESIEATLALFYFFFGLLTLPFISYQIYVQGRILFKYKSTSDVTKLMALQEFKEKYPDAHTMGGVDDYSDPDADPEAATSQRGSALEMVDNPMMQQKEKSRISVVRNHHKNKQREKNKSLEETHAKQWKLIKEKAIGHHAEVVKQKETMYMVCAFLTLGFLFPLNLFASSRFGNDFQWYSNYGIAAWAKHQIEPAIPQITVSNDLNYKFFPQIIIFYVYLYSVICTAVAARYYKPLKDFLDQRPKILKDWDLTWGEALFAAYTVLFTFITFCYIFFNWYAEPHVKWLGSRVSERWGRCLGQTSLFPMGVMVLPISRNSIWAVMLDYPPEQMLKFHRWSAIMFLTLAASHTIAFMGVFGSLGEFPKAMMQSPNSYREEDSTIGMMSGVVFFIVIPVFCVLTMNYVRRNYFEVFYFAHFCSGILFLATLWHSDFGWMYIVPGLTLYLIDCMVRLNKFAKPYEIIALNALEDDIVELTFAEHTNPGYRKKRSLKGGPAQKGEVGLAPEGIHFQMGQYVFMCLPNISVVQSHPFNIASAENDRYTTCYIKSQGPGTFTGDLLDLAKKLKNSSGEGDTIPVPLKYIPIHIEGPYGLPFDYKSCSSILLVGGGIGITPLHCVMRTLLQLMNSDHGLPEECRLKKVRLVWSFKNPDVLFDNPTFESTLKMVPPTTAYLKALARKKLNKGKSKGRSSIAMSEETGRMSTWSANDTRVDESEIGNAKGDDLDAVLREGEEAEAMSHVFNSIDRSKYPTLKGDVIFEIALFCTSGAKGPGQPVAVKRAEKGLASFWHPIIPERCDIAEEISLLKGNDTALVYCVGPSPLLKAATDACSDYGVKFRGETAEF
jgi:predicted ferric reductase